MEEALHREFEQVGSDCWAVFGDRLQEQGDPRGRLYALEHEREALCIEAALLAGVTLEAFQCELESLEYDLFDACSDDACTEESHRQIHEIEALGYEIDALYEEHTEAWLGGLATSIDTNEEGFYSLKWRYGYLQRVHATHYKREHLQLLAALLALPSAQFLCEVHEESNADSMSAVVDALASELRPWRRCAITDTRVREVEQNGLGTSSGRTSTS